MGNMIERMQAILNQQSNSRLICIAGYHGSGKSTLANILSAKYENPYVININERLKRSLYLEENKRWILSKMPDVDVNISVNELWNIIKFNPDLKKQYEAYAFSSVEIFVEQAKKEAWVDPIILVGESVHETRYWNESDYNVIIWGHRKARLKRELDNKTVASEEEFNLLDKTNYDFTYTVCDYVCKNEGDLRDLEDEAELIKVMVSNNYRPLKVSDRTVEKYHKNALQTLRIFVEKIKETLNNCGYENRYTLKPRVKEVEEILGKTLSRGYPIYATPDTVGIRIILDTVEDCNYVEQLFQAHNFDDQRIPMVKNDDINYIERPKKSGYQGIHKSYYKVDGNVGVEVQIMTPEMALFADSTHETYKEDLYASGDRKRSI